MFCHQAFEHHEIFSTFPDPCTDVSQLMRLWLPQSHASMTLTHAVPPSCGRFPALNGLLCFCVEIFCIIMSKIVGDQIWSQMLLSCKQTPQAFPLLHVKVLLDDHALHWVLSFQINILAVCILEWKYSCKLHTATILCNYSGLTPLTVLPSFFALPSLSLSLMQPFELEFLPLL